MIIPTTAPRSKRSALPVACYGRDGFTVEHRIDGQPAGSDLGVPLKLRHADTPLLLDVQLHHVFPSRAIVARARSGVVSK